MRWVLVVVLEKWGEDATETFMQNRIIDGVSVVGLVQLWVRL